MIMSEKTRIVIETKKSTPSIKPGTIQITPKHQSHDQLDMLADMTEAWVKGRNRGVTSKVLRKAIIEQCRVITGQADAVVMQPPGDE